MKPILLSALLIVAASPAAAQAQDPNPLATSGEGLGVMFALQWTSPGVAVDFAKRIAPVGKIRSLNVVGELHLKSGETYDDVSIAGGVRIARHNQRMPSPFVQVLAGMLTERSSELTLHSFKLQPGAGFNFRLPGKNRTLLRTQLDFSMPYSYGDLAAYLRLSAGLEIHFGR
jgi:hypothetical protein